MFEKELTEQDLMELERLIYNLENAEYKFAKTMAYMPHYYTVGDKWVDFDEFIWCAHAIQKFGIMQQFFKEPRKYFYLDEWRYWVMDKDPSDAQIINREKRNIREPKWSEL